LRRADLVELDDSYSFTPEDRPDAVRRGVVKP
jgi:hypothetical protein